MQKSSVLIHLLNRTPLEGKILPTFSPNTPPPQEQSEQHPHHDQSQQHPYQEQAQCPHPKQPHQPYHEQSQQQPLQQETHQNPSPHSPHVPFPFLTLPSLSSFELFHRSQVTRTQSKNRSPPNPSSSVKDFESQCRMKSVSLAENKDHIQAAVAVCSTNLEVIADFQPQKALKPWLDLEKVKKKESI